MHTPFDPDWLDRRIKERTDQRLADRLRNRDPNVVSIDATQFARQLSDLSMTLMHKVEREAPQNVPPSLVVDTGVILRQLNETYNLILFVNAEDTRFRQPGYRLPYSFVILPLVRTMIDGFYNCTALLDDPSRCRTFRISGYYRVRETLLADEAAHGHDANWTSYLQATRTRLENGLRAESLTHADLDNKRNKWPLLGAYLESTPDTAHKQMLRKLTLGFWKEYSSISHASFDGLASMVPFICPDKVKHDERELFDDVADRHIAMHIGRTAGVLLCLLTDIQHFFKFDGADIDGRLSKIWAAIIPMLEVRELFDFRYKDLLKHPLP
ncbi:hypothetical protein [Occallatibacter riparius]|uniref:Uncharacterized protein n=1 Tax=Occallatibacter riparius TaxID=1002689 RepID=A0A9J7BIT2_9BACT|nr:hypothetical protein [Occallatibacter riparius]UWZ82591.1 hypothetical protein MOP44_18710 [Occallatibacter riparius]